MLQSQSRTFITSLLLAISSAASLRAGEPPSQKIVFLTPDAPANSVEAGCFSDLITPLEQYLKSEESESYVKFDLKKLKDLHVETSSIFDKKLTPPIGKALGANLFVMTRITVAGADLKHSCGTSLDIDMKVYSSVNDQETRIGIWKGLTIEKAAALFNDKNRKMRIISAAMVAGEQGAGPNIDTFAQQEKHDDFYMVRYAQTACYGDCPVFNLLIDPEGNVAFDGMAHVKNKGVVKWKLGAEDLGKLRAAILQSDFFEVDPEWYEFPGPACAMAGTDAGGAFMEINLGGKSNSVHHYHGCWMCSQWLQHPSRDSVNEPELRNCKVDQHAEAIISKVNRLEDQIVWLSGAYRQLAPDVQAEVKKAALTD